MKQNFSRVGPTVSVGSDHTENGEFEVRGHGIFSRVGPYYYLYLQPYPQTCTQRDNLNPRSGGNQLFIAHTHIAPRNRCAN
jgi:hypothetical protein